MKNIKIIIGVLILIISVIGMATVKKVTNQKPVTQAKPVAQPKTPTPQKQTTPQKSVLPQKPVTKKATQKKENVNSTKTKKEASKGEHTVGAGNPASVFCGEKGGESIIVKSKKGDFGICRFKDGTAVEEWEYYKDNYKEEKSSPKTQDKTKSATTQSQDTAKKEEKQVGSGSPAGKFCSSKGGKSITVKDKDGNESSKCQLKDGTKVDEWDYYRENNGK